MNKLQFQGHWNQLKGKLKEKFGKLTDDDLVKLSGKRDELIGKLQILYGTTREKIEHQIKEIEDDFYAEELRIHWDYLKAKLKQKWSSLTEDDIQRIKGNADRLIAQLQERYNFAKAKAEAEFHAFIDSLDTLKEKVGMDKLQFQEHWNQLKGKLKEKFGKLTEDDLTKLKGKRDELIEKLQILYGTTREKIEHQIREIEIAFYAEELRIHWDYFKSKLKQKWNSLTEDDIQHIKGNADRLIAQLQERCNFAKAKAEEEFHAFIDSLDTSKEKEGTGKGKEQKR